MFGDTLLESSPALRKRKRWPMATAFTAQTMIAAIIVAVPLLSTGVIPLSARVPIYTPETHIRIERVEPVADRSHSSGPANPVPGPVAVLLRNNNYIDPATNVATTDRLELVPPGNGTSMLPSHLFGEGPATPNVRPDSGPKRKIVVSVLEEARLLNKVEPVYPRPAVLAGIQGEVKLHAIIARNGTIQSLNAVSGHPLLVRAAMDAVGQWRYRPYILNGEAVEVETFITVNFRKEGR
jgi:periplasmic protein TonB